MARAKAKIVTPGNRPITTCILFLNKKITYFNWSIPSCKSCISWTHFLASSLILLMSLGLRSPHRSWSFCLRYLFLLLRFFDLNHFSLDFFLCCASFFPSSRRSQRKRGILPRADFADCRSLGLPHISQDIVLFTVTSLANVHLLHVQKSITFSAVDLCPLSIMPRRSGYVLLQLLQSAHCLTSDFF